MFFLSMERRLARDPRNSLYLFCAEKCTLREGISKPSLYLLVLQLGVCKVQDIRCNYLKELSSLQKKIAKYISIYSRETEHPVVETELSLLGDTCVYYSKWKQ